MSRHNSRWLLDLYPQTIPEMSACLVWVPGYHSFPKWAIKTCNRRYWPHVRGSKTAVDSGYHAMNSGFRILCQWNLDPEFLELISRFQSPGFRIPIITKWPDNRDTAPVQLYRSGLCGMSTSTRFSQYWVLLTREPASFWRENVIAVVILLRVLARVS